MPLGLRCSRTPTPSFSVAHALLEIELNLHWNTLSGSLALSRSRATIDSGVSEPRYAFLFCR